MKPLGIGLSHGARGLFAYGLAGLGLWLLLGGSLTWNDLVRVAGGAWLLVMAWGFWKD